MCGWDEEREMTQETKYSAEELAPIIANHGKWLL